jgi:N-acetylmuramoyl-L-alanine amidase
MVVQDADGKPIGSAKYPLVAGFESFEGTTGGDGRIEHPIAPDLQSAVLDFRYQKPNGVTVHQSWNLKLGHLDDVATPSGLQARLNNLGFDCGDVDGVIGPKTETAIRGFQESEGLDVDGIAGPQTQAKLKSSDGC